MQNNNSTAFPAEEITIPGGIAWVWDWIGLGVRLIEYEVPVHHVRPCRNCGEAIARVSFRNNVNTVDAILDRENSNLFRPCWTANIFKQHVCREIAR